MRKRKNMFDKVFDSVNIILLLIITLITIYPLYFTVIASFSDPYAVAGGKVILWPIKMTLEPYINVLKNDDIWIGYRNSIINTTVVVLYSLALTLPAAYALSKKVLRGRNVIMAYFVFTMYFSGGMIPFYLLIKNMGLMNNRLALILPAGFSVYNMIIARAFFQSTIPEELYDSAKIDGCDEYRTFFQIVMPLSKAIIAVVALYVAVSHWNSWFRVLLFIDKKALYPLQYVLRYTLILNQQLTIVEYENMNIEELENLLRRQYMSEGMKYSIIFISALPMLIAYPFVQKYFVKGVMIGSIKG